MRTAASIMMRHRIREIASKRNLKARRRGLERRGSATPADSFPFIRHGQKYGRVVEERVHDRWRCPERADREPSGGRSGDKAERPVKAGPRRPSLRTRCEPGPA